MRVQSVTLVTPARTSFTTGTTLGGNKTNQPANQTNNNNRNKDDGQTVKNVQMYSVFIKNK